eukprot:m.337087 g.337087  ORF g.337087 m.337087 type:complete len:127 (-) comp16533_c1_seq5:111-491(-)
MIGIEGQLSYCGCTFAYTVTSATSAYVMAEERGTSAVSPRGKCRGAYKAPKESGGSTGGSSNGGSSASSSSAAGSSATSSSAGRSATFSSAGRSGSSDSSSSASRSEESGTKSAKGGKRDRYALGL